MKHLGFSNRVWIVVIATVLLTLTTVFVYRTQTEVMSKSQALEIMSRYGDVIMTEHHLQYNQYSADDGMPTELIESLALTSEYIDVYVH